MTLRSWLNKEFILNDKSFIFTALFICFHFCGPAKVRFLLWASIGMLKLYIEQIGRVPPLMVDRGIHANIEL